MRLISLLATLFPLHLCIIARYSSNPIRLCLQIAESSSVRTIFKWIAPTSFLKTLLWSVTRWGGCLVWPFTSRSSSASNHLFYQPDLCFMASRVITGEAKAVVIRTGDKTFWGYMCLYKRRDSFICVCLLQTAAAGEILREGEQERGGSGFARREPIICRESCVSITRL